MTKTKSLMCLGGFVLSAITSYAQVTTNTALTPTQLVNNVLLGGGVTASNITYTGYSNAIAEFTSPPGSNLGFTNGLYLTTGSALPNDPNNPFGTGQDGPTGPNTNFQSFDQTNAGFGAGDPDLNQLFWSLICDSSGLNVTNDAAILEFDFVPTSDSISFRYRFGSEEYNTFVSDLCTGFGVNDVFAFFLTGVTTPFPQTNIALLPGGSTPVSIFTVNNGTMEPASGPCMNCAYFVDNSVTQVVNVTYDGLTQILTANAAVICGETYHIKLAIADGSDHVWDSGVFIEAGSFSSTGGVQVVTNTNPNTNDTTLLENCIGSEVTFVRTGITTAADTIQYILSGTALPGVDYTGLNGSVIFSPGVDTVVIPVDALLDGVAEGTETIIITINNVGCGGGSYVHTLYIEEPPALTVDAGNDVILDCTTLQQGAQLTATVNGGISPYQYAWSNGANTSTINVNTAGNHVVNVTDFCSQTATDTVNIQVIGANPLFLNVSPDTTICPGSPVQLTAQATGGNGTIDYAWSTGASSAGILVSPTITSAYQVSITDDCGLTASATVQVNVDPVNADFTSTFTLVEGEVVFQNLSTPAGSTYVWDFGDTGNSTDFEPSHTYIDAGTYLVVLYVTNPNGCMDSAVQQIVIKKESYIYIPNTFTPGNGDGINDVFSIEGVGFTDATLKIYNRWGQEIYVAQPGVLSWSGKDASKNLYPQGVYIYKVEYKDGYGLPGVIYGHVNLLR